MIVNPQPLIEVDQPRYVKPFIPKGQCNGDEIEFLRQEPLKLLHAIQQRKAVLASGYANGNLVAVRNHVIIGYGLPHAGQKLLQHTHSSCSNDCYTLRHFDYMKNTQGLQQAVFGCISTENSV